jgi:hypothetical protein
MAKMRRSAGDDDIIFDPDRPHDEWRPRHGRPEFAEWHPPYGESHVKYHVYPIGGGSNQRYWRANEHGLYQGQETIERPGGGAEMRFPVYSNDGHPHRAEPQRIGHPVTGDHNFRTMDEAKAAAEQYHAATYSEPGPDYYEGVMGDLSDPDEGFDIFGEGR